MSLFKFIILISQSVLFPKKKKKVFSAHAKNLAFHYGDFFFCIASAFSS